MAVQVLVDADNLDGARLRLVADALRAAAPSDLVVAGRRGALESADWPSWARLREAAGWQRADLELATAYRSDERPLVLASGDGDFVHLARRHPGPVLVVGAAASSAHALRTAGIVFTDPAADGGAVLRAWLG